MATLNRAIEIAAKVHAGQTDKAGSAYILHPLRMMMKMTSEPAMIAAILHDVVEDCEPRESWTLERLKTEGFSEDVVHAVDCLTKRAGETYDEFVNRGASSQIAHRVKLADLEDNMNLLRLREIRPKDLARLEKYHRAWMDLTALINDPENKGGRVNGNA